MSVEVIRDVAQPGSAFAWGASGRWFESSHPDQPNVGREPNDNTADFIRASFDVLFLLLEVKLVLILIYYFNFVY